MLARIRKSMATKDSGFTLIELLVVMIIIGILAAIAIPTYLTQRQKAEDGAAKSDVSKLGNEISTYFVDNTAAPTVDTSTTSGRYTLKYGSTTVDLGKVSNNVVLDTTTALTSADSWCVAVKNPKGDKAKDGYAFSKDDGLIEGAVCP